MRYVSSSRAKAPTPRSRASAFRCIPETSFSPPGWTWHDHGHLGSAPVIWLDALDNPFGQFFGAIFRENYPGDTHPVSQVEGAAAARYGSNLMPVEHRPQRRASPLLVYPYDRTREALDRVARNEPLHPAHGAKMRYANPNDGYVYPTLAVFIQWMPKGFSRSEERRVGNESSDRSAREQETQ